MQSMKTRVIYYLLRRQYRIARRDLAKSENGFLLCSEITHSLRELTGKWETGTEKPEPMHYWRYKPGKRSRLFVSLTLTNWLKANA